MFRKLTKRQHRSGLTFSEIMCAIAALSIIVIGASGYRYRSTLDARCADEQITAARLGQLLCASWADVDGDETYNPVAHLGSELTIETLGAPKSMPPGFTLLGRYRITINGVAYSVVLNWMDVSTELRALRIKVTWQRGDEVGNNPLEKSFVLITYVQK
jgi:hypothetical protein